MEPTDFGLRLKELRIAAGLTQGQLAERAGLSQAAISDLEQGRRKQPAFDTVVALAKGLGKDCTAFTKPPSSSTEPQGRGRPVKEKPAKKRGKGK